jgi:glutamate-5-semialdehyde dehydrogenase
MTNHVDVTIPRGGKGLIKRLVADARVPTIKHLEGNCHMYIDSDADHTKVINIAFHSKTHCYGICNAMESLLTAKSVASELLLNLVAKFTEKGVELRGCEQSINILPSLNTAVEEDWSEEYLMPILAIKIVTGVDVVFGDGQVRE